MSPLPVESLTPDSPDDAVKEAVSQSIQKCMDEPIPPGTNVAISDKQKW